MKISILASGHAGFFQRGHPTILGQNFPVFVYRLNSLHGRRLPKGKGGKGSFRRERNETALTQAIV